MQKRIAAFTGMILAVLSIGNILPAAGLEAEAIASREQLSHSIAALDGADLRKRLVKTADNQRLARWYDGQVFADNQWLSLQQYAEKASADETRQEYRTQRARMADNLQGHVRLALWCQKQKLPDIARVHWLHVLRFNSNHRAALKQLQLRWVDGLLLTHQEADRYRERKKIFEKEQKKWGAKVKRLRKDLEQGEPQQREVALHELQGIKEPAAVPALVEELAEPAADAKKTVKRRSKLLATLGRIHSQEAVETLVTFAVNAPDDEVRYVALEQLKNLPYEQYVPILLSAMQMPIEAAVSSSQVGNRVVNSYTYSQEKPGGQEYIEDRHSSYVIPGQRYRPVKQYTHLSMNPGYTAPGRTIKVPKNPGHGQEIIPIAQFSGCSSTGPRGTAGYRRRYTDEYLKEVQLPDRYMPAHLTGRFAGWAFREDPAFAVRAQAAHARSNEAARRAKAEVAQHNMHLQQRNEQIAGVLTELTGETLSAFPKSWWNWWSEYLDKHPGVANAGARRNWNAALLNREPRGLAQGTWVWTDTGKRPIEEILPGDYVLSQNPRTGELACKPVLAIMGPQVIPVFRVDFGDAELHCAPGHVVWTAGSGWQRVSKLIKGRPLHGAVSESRWTAIEAAFEIPSYDLIVDEFHTLCVGETGLLVHDATPIAPTHVGLPGISPAALAAAVQLAARDR